MHSRPRQSIALALATVLPVLLLFAGIWLGGHPADLPGFVRNAFVADHNALVVDDAIADVAHDYYRPLTDASLDNAAIAGIVASLKDPFSNYLTPAEYGGFEQPQSYSGIGVETTPETSGLLIGRVFAQSPAARSGLHAGELITAVDGRSLRGVATATAVNLVTGPAGSIVTLTLRQGDTVRTARVVRAVLSEPLVATQTLTYDHLRFGLVALSSFSQGAATEVRQAVEAQLRQGVRGLVLDLRDNGGGLVEQARLVASIFIPQGVIVTTRGRTQPTVTLMAAGGAIASDIPLVVLVDSDTASSSEIVTAALQDHRRALVVGTHTFGKGVFQEVRPLANGGALDITVGQYFTPNGRNLGGHGVSQGAGVTPNVKVPAAQVDGQQGVQAALRTLAGEIK